MSTLAEDYLEGYGGSVSEYRSNLERGQRIGQAFFNAVNDEDRELLRGTSHDPFYVQHGPALIKIIEWLLDRK